MSEREPLRVLAVGAHPDDIELGCAGTLARCAQRGDSVTMAIVCRGDSASSSLTPPELIKLRSRESHDSARVIGAELIELGLHDGEVEVNRATKDLVTDVIRAARPDVIITHFHSDYGTDHNNTLTLVVDATVNATVAYFATAHPPIKTIPLLFMMEPSAGHGFLPQVYVDITATFATKARMLACHRSQFEWMSRYGGMDFGKYLDVVARFRGYQARVEFAEGFIPHPTSRHIAAGPVLP